MSRIRSVHPGFFTDETLVSVSMGARLLFIGLGIEADDKGIFEWKPLTIKMRVFPADNVDVAAMLAELHDIGAVRSYEMEGRKYGAIRNFRVFQRPKTPNDIHPITDDIRSFVGLPVPISETFPPKGEKSPQMEDGGWRMEEEVEKKEEGGDPASASDAAGHYAFSGSVIRLAETDLHRWRRTYHAIPDLVAELSAIDGWWVEQPPDKAKKWFHATQSMLNRKHQELLKSGGTAEPERFIGI